MTLSAHAVLIAALQIGGLAGDSEVAPEPRAVRTEVGRAPLTHDGSARQLDVQSPWISEADIRIDGRLDDAAWSSAPVLHGFTQFQPLEGVGASQRTEARILLTDEAVYLAVEAFDDEPGGIRGTLAQRDSYGRSDDYVRFVLDTFDDQRRAFVFQVNPLGVQGDGLWIEGRGGRGGPVDWSPNFAWESAGRMLPDRYVVEIKVPFKSLRFPDAPVQDWGFQVVRRYQRNGFEESWAPMTNDQANQLAQAGRISALRDLDPGVFLEINPVATGGRSGAMNADGDLFEREPTTGDFGLNLTYGLTSNLTLDGTFNPDFSQVEADAGQITVNERFALFLREARPFFLEGTDVFAMPMQLVYTRSIANPIGAAKLSGKLGGVSVAYLGAVDDVAGNADRPLVNLLRIRKDVGSSSTVGLVYTGRAASGVDFNRVLGTDARLVLGGRYALDLLAAGSADATAATDTEYGSLLVARFNRAGRSFSLSGGIEDVDDSFRARSGFIRRLGVTQLEARTGYTWRGNPGALLESFGPSVEVRGFWDRDDFWAGRGPEESEVQVSLSGSLRGNVGGFVALSRSGFAPAAGDYEGLFVTDADGRATTPFAPASSLFEGLDGLSLRGWLSSWERARVSLGGSVSETPIFDRSLGLPAEVATRWSGDVNVSLIPTGSLTAELGLRHVTLRRQSDRSSYSTATIPRVQARYQFSRALFARVIGEYASQERSEVRDPLSGQPLARCTEDGCSVPSGSDAYDFSLEALLGYEPTPGTVVFVGYSRSMRDTEAFRFREVQTQADGLFVKLSYRFRL